MIVETFCLINIINKKKHRDCRFETLWLCYEQPLLKMMNSYSFGNTPATNQTSDVRDKSLVQAKFDCLNTRGAYVSRLSHSTELLALACNQKYVEHNCLLFMSVSNGTVLPVNLRNFGLNLQARGRFVLENIFISQIHLYKVYFKSN
jgi:hypothetical protein